MALISNPLGDFSPVPFEARQAESNILTSPARTILDPQEAACRAASWGFVFFLPAVGMGEAITEARDRLGDLTRQVFEPRAGRRLTGEDVREIGENLVGFFGVLGEWSRAERQAVPSGPKPAEQIDKTSKRGGLERVQGEPRASRTVRQSLRYESLDPQSRASSRPPSTPRVAA